MASKEPHGGDRGDSCGLSGPSGDGLLSGILQGAGDYGLANAPPSLPPDPPTPLNPLPSPHTTSCTGDSSSPVFLQGGLSFLVLPPPPPRSSSCHRRVSLRPS